VDINKFYPDYYTRQIMRKRFNISENETIVITTARLAKEKCLHRLINAFDLLSQKFKNNWLFIVGDGPLREDLEGLARSKQSKVRIKFLGFQEDVTDYLKMSDIYVLPSENEGLAIALLEAMATGLIVVATNTPGPSEIICDGFNGFLVDNTEMGVVRGMRKAFLLTEEQRQNISKNAIDFIRNNFDMSKNIKEELEVFALYE